MLFVLQLLPSRIIESIVSLCNLFQLCFRQVVHSNALEGTSFSWPRKPRALRILLIGRTLAVLQLICLMRQFVTPGHQLRWQLRGKFLPSGLLKIFSQRPRVIISSPFMRASSSHVLLAILLLATLSAKVRSTSNGVSSTQVEPPIEEAGS